MAKKSLLLLSLMLLNILPAAPVQAENELTRRFDESLSFLYLSDAILAPESALDLSYKPPGLIAPNHSPQQQDQVDINPLLARIIHAKKLQRNELDANCKLLVQNLKAQGKDCEAEQIQSYCSEKREELNILIGYYRQKRGDQRKFFTRVWHSIKKDAANFWHRIGPVGRNFLRHMGDEALQIVASGGTLSGSTLKTLIKRYVKTQARQRLEEIVYQGVEHLLLGQLAVARAAGVDICSDEVFPDQTSSESQESDKEQPLALTMETSEINFEWHALYQPNDPFHTCGGLWVDSPDDDFSPQQFTLNIDPGQRTLSGSTSGYQSIVNLAEGKTGDVVTDINQNFAITFNGPYEIEDDGIEQTMRFVGNAQISLSSSGKVYCHYWELNDSGDAYLQNYWVQNSGNKDTIAQIVIYIYSEDRETGTLSVDISVPNWNTNSYFFLQTHKTTLNSEQLDKLWTK